MPPVLPQLVNRLTSPVRGLAVLFCLALALSACGSDSTTTSADASQSPDSLSDSDTDVDTDAENAADAEGEDDDHGDEDHDGEEHDEDHEGEDHDDHDDESGSLGAHEHGTAEMTIAWVDGDLTIDMISPNFNVFGFEYEPESDEDIATEAQRIETLTTDGILSVDDDAECTATEPVETEIERDGTHSEITVTWQFTCENPDAITELDASTLFTEFPSFEDIDAQWLSPTDQGAGELSPSAPSLSLQS